ncbi:uncharacterized protein LOC110035377 [Phalaenopsis equestris]|uniref:uncharacterized protein LOC110035377 n=1 Tax=Phalaenopsis equestris TaxID=78828 RepID=UPI0009E59C41|nr:uncharacterized protein LOC110035377 [Phalaenopsis equestris]
MLYGRRFCSPACKMNRTPEKLAGDLAPPPAAVSFGHAIPHHSYDINADRENEQTSYSSGSDLDEEGLFQLQSAELGDSSTKPPRMPIFVDNEIRLSAKQFSRKPPPPIRYDVPDPNRIPMSVFARSTATTSPKEWSVASNESLFSIQLGNSSFSREQGMLLMGRSEDLMSGSLECPPPRVMPARGAIEGNVKLVDVNKMKEVEEEKTTGYPLIDSISRQSDCSSTTSFGSFAFPVLTREGKSESIKVISKQHAEQQPPPLIHPLNAPTAAPSPPLASAKMRWFPCCFCWCQLCC